jgi:hypothetical protein
VSRTAIGCVALELGSLPRYPGEIVIAVVVVVVAVAVVAVAVAVIAFVVERDALAHDAFDVSEQASFTRLSVRQHGPRPANKRRRRSCTNAGERLAHVGSRGLAWHPSAITRNYAVGRLKSPVRIRSLQLLVLCLGALLLALARLIRAFEIDRARTHHPSGQGSEPDWFG